MPLPNEPVTLSAEQVAELNQKLTMLRHNVNNQLSLIMAATELIRRKPENSERMWVTLSEQPHKIAAAVNEFYIFTEAAFRKTKP
jgi:hypothetical protein